MVVNSYEIDAEYRLVSIALDRVVERAGQPDTVLWLDVEGQDLSARETWLDRFGVDGLGRRLCLEAGDRPGLYPLKQEIVLVFPVLCESGDAPEVHYVTCLCREGLLLTLHDRSLMTDERLVDIECAEAWLSERSIAALLSAILIDLSMDDLRLVGHLRSAIVGLEERMEQDPDTVEAEEIMTLRSNGLSLSAVVGDMLPVAQALGTTERSFFRLDKARDFMRCALVNLQAASGQLTWLDGRISALRAGFELHAQERTNRRLGTLTILSAVFMPVTLLAGIWGMNFESMPELGQPYAYPIALGTMAAVGTGMCLFFRRTGWFE